MAPTVYSPACMQKAPERVRGLPHFLAWECVHKSGGDSACLLLHDLRFGAEPVVQRMAVFPAAGFVEFLRAEADLVSATVGKPELPLTRLAGSLYELPDDNSDQWLEAILRDSPAIKIAQLGVLRAEASLARAKREPIPDLQLRGGLQQNRELEATTNRPIGLQGFAEVGVQIPIFNRTQGNVQAFRADVERAKREVQRVQLLLRERAAALVQNYVTSRATVEKYRNRMIPRAQKAYDLYMKSYGAMAAAYPQVLISQRTLFQLQSDYVVALETLWGNSIALRGFLLTDGLEAPSRPGEMDQPVRELNVPSSTPSMQPQ